MAELLNENEVNEVAGGTEYKDYMEYTVIYGDTLSGLAYRFQTTVEFLARLNNIAAPWYIITVGQKLLVPKPKW